MADSLPHLSPVLAALCTPGAMGGRAWRNSEEKRMKEAAGGVRTVDGWDSCGRARVGRADSAPVPQ